MSDWSEAEQHVERAQELYDAGRWEEAEQALRHAIALNPYQPEWHFNLGLTLDAAGRTMDAVASFAKAFDLAPNDANPALMAARCCVVSNRAAEAIDWLDKAEGLEIGGGRGGDRASDAFYPSFDEPYGTERDDRSGGDSGGDAHLGPDSGSGVGREGRARGGAEDQARVIRIDALAALGRHDEAETAFYVGQELDPDNPELYVAMSVSLMDRSLHEKAVWCLRQAARLEPDHPGLHARLAEAYAATGRRERARQLYLRELRRDPGDTDTLLDLGDLLADMNRFQEAGEKYRRVLELEPDHPDAHAALGELALRVGDRASARVQFDVAHRLDPDLPRVRRLLAEALMDDAGGAELRRVRELLREESRETLSALDTRRGGRPDGKGVSKAAAADVEEARKLAAAMLDAGLPGEAAAVLERLAARDPADADTHHLLSLARFGMGDVSQGVDSARHVVRLDPRHVAAMHNLALAHLKLGRLTRARFWLASALRVDPEDPAVRRLRTRVRWASVLRLLGRPLA